MHYNVVEVLLEIEGGGVLGAPPGRKLGGWFMPTTGGSTVIVTVAGADVSVPSPAVYVNGPGPRSPR